MDNLLPFFTQNNPFEDDQFWIHLSNFNHSQKDNFSFSHFEEKKKKLALFLFTEAQIQKKRISTNPSHWKIIFTTLKLLFRESSQIDFILENKYFLVLFYWAGIIPDEENKNFSFYAKETEALTLATQFLLNSMIIFKEISLQIVNQPDSFILKNLLTKIKESDYDSQLLEGYVKVLFQISSQYSDKLNSLDAVNFLLDFLEKDNNYKKTNYNLENDILKNILSLTLYIGPLNTGQIKKGSEQEISNSKRIIKIVDFILTLTGIQHISIKSTGISCLINMPKEQLKSSLFENIILNSVHFLSDILDTSQDSLLIPLLLVVSNILENQPFFSQKIKDLIFPKGFKNQKITIETPQQDPSSLCFRLIPHLMSSNDALREYSVKFLLLLQDNNEEALAKYTGLGPLAGYLQNNQKLGNLWNLVSQNQNQNQRELTPEEEKEKREFFERICKMQNKLSKDSEKD